MGSHTVDHERLTELEADAIRSQVRDAKAWLLDNGFEGGASSFVYPWGINDPRRRRHSSGGTFSRCSVMIFCNVSRSARSGPPFVDEHREQREHDSQVSLLHA
ncbi:hypothetical protein [Haloarcula sp. JP-L23]|uniref:hypothetical protein n=1 Tax=Haloarcula sp. JP-L23 TaxID=2716717 RepID=UPI0037432EFC